MRMVMDRTAAVACVFTAASVLVLCCVVISKELNRVQPEPYMDEIFHVPQAQNYCAHQFSHWNPMITTPPGLYLSTLLWVEPVSLVTSSLPSSYCTVELFRAQNVVMLVLTFVLLHWLLQRTRKKSPVSHSARLLASFNMATFPLLFFFSFLYYTDVGAVLCLLLGYALALGRHYTSSAIVLAVSIMFRQTSVVWVVFVAGAVGLDIIEKKFNHQRTGKHTLQSYASALLSSVFANLPSLLRCLWPYAVLLLMFCVCVVWNGSIVLGDKSHHQACLHLPQLLYFALFAFGFSAVPVAMDLRALRVFLVRLLYRPTRLLVFVGLSAFGFLAVHHYTYEHPYLLADNRHYTFYVWKDIFKRSPAVPYLLVPAYSFAIMHGVHQLLKLQSFLWVVLYCVCVSVSLVPQKLLEFRYFLVPYLLLRLHSPQGSLLCLVLEQLALLSVNALTLHLFLYRPFPWPDSALGPQRFMW